MIIWFMTLLSIGIWRVTFDPLILRAFNPWEAITYLIQEKQRGFIQIGTSDTNLKLYNQTVMIFFLLRWSLSLSNRS